MASDGRTYGNGSVDVLGEQDALDLNDEEVDQLLDILQRGLQLLAREGEVGPGPDPGGDALTQGQLSDGLGSGHDTQGDPQKPQAVADERNVAGNEDEDDGSGIADGRGTRVLPAKEIVEEGVVVGEGLAGGSLGLGCGAR